MIITTIEELRIAAPAHALDSIDGIAGFIDNSEHDFLEEKLGTPLYEKLCKWYDESSVTRLKISDYKTGCYNRLLLLCQRVVAFDALGRAAGMQMVSVNNAGINQLSAEDYKAADDKSVETYRQTCQKEAHAALNQMLRMLEQWCCEEGKTDSKSGPVPGDAINGETTTDRPMLDGSAVEKKEIVTLWKQSSYYYLAAAMLIPSCQVMQQYLNIYDNREKFIQMLPELRFIQEEQLAPAIGEHLMLAVIAFARDGVLPTPASQSPSTDSTLSPDSFSADSGSVAALSLAATMSRLVHRLRKVMTALLVGRTGVLKYNKEQKIQAHDDGVRMLQNVVEYLRQHQADFPEVLVKDADWYVEPATVQTTVPDAPAPEECGSVAADAKRSDSAACWTPPLF